MANEYYQNNITPWLEVNKNSCSSNIAAKTKVLQCFPDLNMTPLFQWDLKLLPFAMVCRQSQTNGHCAVLEGSVRRHLNDERTRQDHCPRGNDRLGVAL